MCSSVRPIPPHPRRHPFRFPIALSLVLAALLGVGAPPVQAAPSFTVDSIDPVVFTTSPGTGSGCTQPTNSVTLPDATGTGTISYTITPTLPAGITLSGRDLTAAPATVQAQAATAYTYTATDDADAQTASLTLTIEVVDERAVLQTLYNATDGPNWKTTTGGWANPITATCLADLQGVTLTSGRVARISLIENKLTGSIPPELGKLTGLTRLFLNSVEPADPNDNQLTGEIPPELGKLTRLTQLQLHNNQLTGEIPPELGTLTELTWLWLYNNQLTGEIPDLSKLAKLRLLHLHNNQLSGAIPAGTDNANNPTGLAKLTNLEVLSLSDNQLTGEIPPELGTLANLLNLYLDNNQLSGALPTELGSLANLSGLFLNNNRLEGALPTELGNLTYLTYLWLHNNQLSGTIPTQLDSLTSLIWLYLHNNQLSGTIPTQLGSLTSLQRLYLHDNQLTGALPTQLGSLASLQGLYLYNNRLSGALPTELGSLANLQQLYLYNNPLSGPVPSGWGGSTYPLTSLTDLDLSYTNLTGTLPTALATRRDADPPTLTVTWDTIVDRTSLPTEVASVRIEWASPPDPTVTDPTAFSVGPPAGTTFPEPRQIYTLTALDSGGDAVTDRLSASIEVCLPRPAGLTAPLYVYRYQPAADTTQPGRWERLTAGWRVSDREVCATVSQFSDFQVGTYTPPPPPPPSRQGGGGGRPRDDHGNSASRATRIPLTARMVGQIGTRSDVDYFTLTVPHAGILVVETTGSTDTRGTVWQDGARLATADSGGTGQNFRLSVQAEAGPVVIAVRGNGRQTGRYVLQTTLVVGFLENPSPDSFQSGIGTLSGWVCEADEVVLEINGTPFSAAYGTARSDTQDTCGDTDNGFGLLFNWNELGDGRHEVVALVDGVELSRTSVTVTTLGTPFLREASGTCEATDFPSTGEHVTLVWQEAKQNFVITDGGSPPTGSSAVESEVTGFLENPAPNSFQSGVGLLSGWVCEADGVTLEIDGQTVTAAYGTDRADTADACGDTDNGFGLLFNWNELGDGDYEVIARADGVAFDRATVRVVTLGEPFLREARGTCEVVDFPEVGDTVTLTWQTAQQNFVITAVR